MASSKQILIIDDDEALRRSLAEQLELHEGFVTFEAEDGRRALEIVKDHHFEVILMDVGLPDTDGRDLCRLMRRQGVKSPIIMLTAKTEEPDRLQGLDTGADDYITKPFSMREFRSRVKAALRRSRMGGEPLDEEPIDLGDLKIDFARRMVTLRREEVRVTYVEFEILAALARSPGRVLSRETLLEHVWGDSEYRDPRTVDVHIRHLREKLESDPKEPEFLFTVRGVGYRFRE